MGGTWGGEGRRTQPGDFGTAPPQTLLSFVRVRGYTRDAVARERVGTAGQGVSTGLLGGDTISQNKLCEIHRHVSGVSSTCLQVWGRGVPDTVPGARRGSSEGSGLSWSPVCRWGSDACSGAYSGETAAPGCDQRWHQPLCDWPVGGSPAQRAGRQWA